MALRLNALTSSQDVNKAAMTKADTILALAPLNPAHEFILDVGDLALHF
jgi:hypothetical protein